MSTLFMISAVILFSVLYVLLKTKSIKNIEAFILAIVAAVILSVAFVFIGASALFGFLSVLIMFMMMFGLAILSTHEFKFVFPTILCCGLVILPSGCRDISLHVLNIVISIAITLGNYKIVKAINKNIRQPF
jgi:hypothetical protein